jgi:hypothetical protein
VFRLDCFVLTLEWYQSSIIKGGEVMSEPTSKNNFKPTVLQRVLDDNSLLLFLCITVPTVFYILWGVMEVLSIPLNK